MPVLSIDMVSNPADAIKGFVETRRAARSLAQSLNVVNQTADKLSTVFRGIGISMAAVGGAATLSMTGATISAARFEDEMTNVRSLLGLTTNEFHELSGAVLESSTSVEVSARNMAEGLYDVASAGFDGQEGLMIIEASAVAASAGMTDTAVAANGLTAALNAYGISAQDVTEVSDILFQTVNLGVVTFEELVQGMGSWLPVASAAGISLEDASAALSAMTLSGLEAAEASTALGMTMNAFIKPSEEMVRTVQDLGHETPLTMVQTLGLAESVKLLHGETGGSVDELGKLFLEVRALRGVAALGANNFENYNASLSGIADSANRAGATQRVFAIQTADLSSQVNIARGQISAMGTDLGTYITPALTEGTEQLNLFLGGWQEVPGEIKGAVAWVALAGGAFFTLGGIILAWQAKALAVTTAISALNARMGLSIPTTHSLTRATAHLVAQQQILGTTVGVVARGWTTQIMQTRLYQGTLGQLNITLAGTKTAMMGLGVATSAAIPGFMLAANVWSNINQNADEAFDTFMQGLPEPTNLQEWRDNMNALNAEFEATKDSIAPDYDPLTDLFAGGQEAAQDWEETLQNLNPFVANTISETEELTQRQQDQLNRLKRQHETFTELVDEVQRTLANPEVRGKSFVSEFSEEIGLLEGQLTESMIFNILNDLGVAMEDLPTNRSGTEFNMLKRDILDYAIAVASGEDNTENLALQLQNLDNPLRELDEEMTDLADSTEFWADQLDRIGDPLSAITDVSDTIRNNREKEADAAISGLEDQIEAERDASEEQKRLIDERYDSMITGAQRALDAQENATDEQRWALEDQVDAWRDAADREKEAIDDGTDAIEEGLREQIQAARDGVDDFELTIADYIEAFKNANRDINEYVTLFNQLSMLTDDEFAAFVAGMGEEGEAIAAAIVESTDPQQQQELINAIQENMRLRSDEFAIQVDASMQVAARVGREGANNTVSAINEELGLGMDETASIIEDFTMEAAGMLNPLLETLGRDPIVLPHDVSKDPSQAAQQGVGEMLAQPRADGGHAGALGTFLVGEKGPELLQMGARSGYVWSNSDTTAMAGNSVVIQHHYHFEGDVVTEDPAQLLQFAERKSRQAALAGER